MMAPRKTPFVLPPWTQGDRPVHGSPDLTVDVIDALGMTLSTGKAIIFTCDDPRAARALIQRLRYQERRKAWGDDVLRTVRRNNLLHAWITADRPRTVRAKAKRRAETLPTPGPAPTTPDVQEP